MLLNFLRSGAAAPGERKSSAVGALVAFQSGGRPIWTPRDAVSLTRSGYQGNAVVFRCVRMVAEATAAIPFALVEDGRRMDVHPLATLLSCPNNGQDGAGLIEALCGHLMLHGDAYLEAAALDEANAPLELHALRPDRMRVAPGPDGWPAAYEYRVAGRAHRFDMTTETQPILHLKAFHPLDDHYGMSPLEAAANAIDVHNAAGAWSKALLDNAARPSGAIVAKGADGGTLTDEQFSRLSEELETSHQGARNAGRPMLLEGGLDWKPMSFSPADMEFLKTREAAAREIALAFGVPPQLLGLPGDNAYANYQEANRAFYRQTVLPLSRRIASALTGWLGWRWPGDVRLAPDLEAVTALQTEREAQWRRIANADFLDDDEKREMLGLPPRPASREDG
ncbi:MAG: phage portal protein [Pseudomonadota bacterium]